MNEWIKSIQSWLIEKDSMVQPKYNLIFTLIYQ